MTDQQPAWTRFGSGAFAAAVLVFLNGLYMALVAFGNITDFDTNRSFVQHVLAMDTTNFGAEPGRISTRTCSGARSRTGCCRTRHTSP